MGKLRLEMEHLQVESFEVQEAEAQGRGTVHGQLQETDPRVCESNGCRTLNYSNCASCDQTCVGTCIGDYTCNALASCDLWACGGSEYGDCTQDWTCGTW